MHKAIISQNERTIIKTYLETGEKLPGFRMLKHRVSQYKTEVFGDFHLINQFLISIQRLDNKTEEN